jgi:hypothetical protein
MSYATLIEIRRYQLPFGHNYLVSPLIESPGNEIANEWKI